jgi:hypothetical protein
MTDVVRKTREGRGNWTFSSEALQRLLDWLDGEADSDGRAYLEMRRRLRDYIARKNCPAPGVAGRARPIPRRALSMHGRTH